ncbi:MAG: ABC-type transport auxiliary lipoprotein family protein [Legionellales bacterium]|nr:ABC-type transport auxiliary lipoprotein family protein [Legionellales bacterium]
MKKLACLICVSLILTACSAIKVPVSHQYKLDAFSAQTTGHKKTNLTLLVSVPEALAGNQTEQIHYLQKPYALDSFVNNAWVSSPANMIYPLIIESLQKTHYFHAVASGPYADRANYRLDTQLISLQQNFQVKPSIVDLVVHGVITHIEDNRIVASRTFHERAISPSDTPYGGVIAANLAVKTFTSNLSSFVVKEIENDSKIVRNNSQK